MKGRTGCPAQALPGVSPRTLGSLNLRKGIKEANRSLEIRLNLPIALTVLSTTIGGYIAYHKS
jgi:hypothetical protein